MREGPLAALDVIEQVTGEREVDAIGYCVGGTLLAATLAYMAANEDTPHRLGDLVRGAGRFHPCRRSQGVRRRGADRSARARNGRTRLPRGQEDGDRLQPAALERPDLALRHQQLSQGQGAVALRPALLEFGRNAHAGGQPLVLSAQLLSGEQAQQGRDGDRRQAARPQEREGFRSTISPPARITSRRRSRSCSARNSSAARCVSCSPARATSPAWSIRRTR